MVETAQILNPGDEPGEFATDPSQITPEWLTRVLRRAGALESGRVSDIDRLLVNRLDASIVVRLRPVFTREAPPGAPAALFLKLSRPDAPQQFIERHDENEVTFYQRVAPLMTDSPSVRCFEARYAENVGTAYILLENLLATHSRPVQPLPPSVENCRRAMECLAQFHASWWGDRRLGTEIGTLAQGDRLFPDELRPHIRPFLDLLGDRLSPRRRQFFERLLASTAARWSNAAHPANLTIVHGDAHAWNFFYPRNPAHDRVRMFDWQRWRVDVGPRDVAHFIARCWYRDRRQWLELELLRRYHATLQASGVGHYRWEDCWHDYRKSVIRQLIVPVRSWVQGRKASHWWAILERVCLAFEDLDCEELLED